jgi:hypothetical protein
LKDALAFSLCRSSECLFIFFSHCLGRAQSKALADFGEIIVVNQATGTGVICQRRTTSGDGASLLTVDRCDRDTRITYSLDFIAAGESFAVLGRSEKGPKDNPEDLVHHLALETCPIEGLGRISVRWIARINWLNSHKNQVEGR